MKPSRALAAAQTIAKRGDVDANTSQHLQLAAAAAKLGADVVVFPELSLTGYELDLAAELAFSEDDARLEPLRDRAAEHSLTLIAGAPTRLGNALHIGAFVMGPTGSVEVYTKRRMGAFPREANPGGRVPPPERSVFMPGSRDPLVPFSGGFAAVAVCADIKNPGIAARAADRGARTLLASMFVIPGDFEGDRDILTAAAKSHDLAVVFANYGGPTGGLPSAGRSAVLAPGGELLVELRASGPGLAVAIETDSGWQAEALMLDV